VRDKFFLCFPFAQQVFSACTYVGLSRSLDTRPTSRSAVNTVGEPRYLDFQNEVILNLNFQCILFSEEWQTTPFAFSSNPALSLISQSREIVVPVITHNFKEFAGNYPNIRTNLG
jgi:hypothetical protein